MPPIRIFHSLEEARSAFGPCALSIGNFDGVHAGHKALVRRMVRYAAELGVEPAIMTFHPHPAAVVAPERVPPLLTTPEERCELMAQEGVRKALIVPFTEEFSRLTPDEFVRKVLREALNVRAVVVGENFRFGHRHAGDIAVLAELGKQYGVLTGFVPPVLRRGRTVSSSEVRRALSAGRVSLAARLLERFYALEGAVVRGQGVGSRLTAPTLNLEIPGKMLPAEGVYVTRTTDLDAGRRWRSVTNVGRRPTFGGGQLSIETFLLDPLEESPRRLRVEFLRRLREERKFESPEALKAQIFRDVERALAWHRRASRWVREERGENVLSV